MSDAPSPVSDDALAQARRHVAALRGLYIHATTYGLVIGLLFAINFMTGRPWWFVWPALGWGIGLAFHAFAVHGRDSVFGRDWEERKVREYLEQQRKR